MAGRNDHMLAGKLVLFLMFGFIVSLVFALSAEYQSNQFQQRWISDNASWLQYLLNGYLAAALVRILASPNIDYVHGVLDYTARASLVATGSPWSHHIVD